MRLASDPRYVVVSYAPGRHHHCIEIMSLYGLGGEDRHNIDGQGFIAEAADGYSSRFVGRLEAKIIAQKAGQIIRPEPIKPELYSENVW